MARIPWTFYDPVATTTYSLEINPSDVSGLDTERGTAISEVMPDGTVAIIENAVGRRKLSVSGTILSQGLLDAWDTWSRKGNAITVTDDLGRSFSMVISSFKAQRARKFAYPWFHTFSAELVETL